MVLDQDRLRLIGLTPQEIGLQLQAILDGAPTTQMRDGIRSVDVVARSPGPERHGLENISNVSLTTRDGRSIPLSQIAHFESRMEDALLKRYNREPYIAVQRMSWTGSSLTIATMISGTSQAEKYAAYLVRYAAGCRIDRQ